MVPASNDTLTVPAGTAKPSAWHAVGKASSTCPSRQLFFELLQTWSRSPFWKGTATAADLLELLDACAASSEFKRETAEFASPGRWLPSARREEVPALVVGLSWNLVDSPLDGRLRLAWLASAS